MWLEGACGMSEESQGMHVSLGPGAGGTGLAMRGFGAGLCPSLSSTTS